MSNWLKASGYPMKRLKMKRLVSYLLREDRELAKLCHEVNTDVNHVKQKKER